jgi:VanZ family protein
MTFNSRLKWIRLCGVVALAVIIAASLMLPAKLEQLRTGHWEVEHFLAYFAATSIIYLGWRRPFVVAGALITAAALLEALQGLSPNHSANLLAVLSGAGGVLAAVLLAKFIVRARNRRALTGQQGGKPQLPAGGSRRLKLSNESDAA